MSLEATSAITVNAEPAEVYAVWRDLERLPSFMYHLESVRTTGERTSHWVARGPAGTTVEWDAEITDDVAGERIAWQSLEGATVDNAGSVRFVPAPRDQGTEIHAQLTYAAPGGPVAALAAKLFGEEPNQQLADDLRRCKQVIETGEIARSDASPLGPRTHNALSQRDGHPTEKANA
jgi:uncharacterized membrane protein